MLLNPIQDKWILLFLGGMIICSAVELLGGFLLDKIFYMRWWDYSDNPFNVGGYICLGFSIMWGLVVVFSVRMIHPWIIGRIEKMPELLENILICVFMAIFITDMTVTLKNLIGIKKSLGQLDKIAEELHNIGDKLKDVVGKSAITVAEKADISEARGKFDNISDMAKERFENISEITKEKIDEVNGIRKEIIDERRKELEERREVLIEKIQRNRKHMLNSLPLLNKSGKSINIKGYINSLKRK